MPQLRIRRVKRRSDGSVKELTVGENVILSHVMMYLRGEGYFVWRENSGIVNVRGHQYRMGARGIPDICGMTPDGRWLGIECKRPGTYQNENQKMFEEQVKKNNGIYIVARSVNDVMRALESYKKRLGQDSMDQPKPDEAFSA